MKYKEDILQMLFKAYFDARKHKRNKQSQLLFELHLEDNIFNLYHDIVNKTYTPGTSICFVVNKPVKREIFAANFRDRVVHHFIFNILNPLVEKILLHDVYSCRKNKGTLFGINRAYSKMQSCSNNFKERIGTLDERFNFVKDFDYSILSYEYGLLKPELFNKIKEKTGFDNSEVLIIDDGANLITEAKNQGFEAILCEDPDKVEEYLKKFSVL